MIENDKLQFSRMMKALCVLFNKPELDKEILRIWFHKLIKYEITEVSYAFDKWTDSNKRMPVPADIIEICRAQQDRKIPVMIGRKFSPEEKERNRSRLNKMLAELNIRSSGL